jgi:1-acyl-sn-glycerol-3-phosphate acyltransferase
MAVTLTDEYRTESPWFLRSVGITQAFLFWLSRLAMLATGSRARTARFRLDPHTKYVLAANHQSMLDGPFIIASLPPEVGIGMMPIRFFIANIYFNKRPLRPLFLLMGCFPASAHDEYPYGLDFARAALSNHQAVFIFPEGQRTLPGRARVHRGVAVLSKLPDVQVIPVHINWTHQGLLKRRAGIHIGKPFVAAGMTAPQIMAQIYNQEN